MSGGADPLPSLAWNSLRELERDLTPGVNDFLAGDTGTYVSGSFSPSHVALRLAVTVWSVSMNHKGGCGEKKGAITGAL
jgi:hypothetical protein